MGTGYTVAIDCDEETRFKADFAPLENFGRKCQVQQMSECYPDEVKNSQILRLFN
jgi:hypothetical protein